MSLILLALAGFRLIEPVSLVVMPASPARTFCASEMPATPRPLALHSANVLISTEAGFAVQKGESYPVKDGYKNVFDHLKMTEKTFPNWVSCNYGARNNFSKMVRLPPGTDECVVTYTKRVTVTCK